MCGRHLRHPRAPGVAAAGCVSISVHNDQPGIQRPLFCEGDLHKKLETDGLSTQICLVLLAFLVHERHKNVPLLSFFASFHIINN